MKRKISIILALIMCLSLAPLSVSAADVREVEDNSAFSTANEIVLNTVIKGRLDEGELKDYFKFTLAGQQEVNIEYNFTAGEPRHLIYLYDSAGKELHDKQLWGIPFPYTINKILNAGTYYICIGYINVDTNQTDDYSITVKTAGGATVPTTVPSVPVMATVAPPTAREVEDNGSVNTATPLTLGTSLYGRIDSGELNDYYKIVLPTNGSIRLAYNFTAGIPHHDLFLYDSQSNEIYDERMSDIAFPFTSPRIRLAAGTYYIRVGYVNVDTNRTDDYSIGVAFTDESLGGYEVEDNSAFSTANTLAINTAIKGGLAANDTKDYYKFTLTAAQNVAVEYNFSAGEPGHLISLYDSAGNELRSSQLLDAAFPYTISQTLNAGTYYVCVGYVNAYTNLADDYTLTVKAY